jgi:hypothetical protein
VGETDEDDATDFLFDGGSEKIFEVSRVRGWQEYFWVSLKKNAGEVNYTVHSL